jgi:hypothetical protein
LNFSGVLGEMINRFFNGSRPQQFESRKAHVR